MGLGKRRSKLGKFLDDIGVSQIELAERSEVSTGTISKLCSISKLSPNTQTAIRIIKALNKKGYKVEIGDFW